MVKNGLEIAMDLLATDRRIQPTCRFLLDYVTNNYDFSPFPIWIHDATPNVIIINVLHRFGYSHLLHESFDLSTKEELDMFDYLMSVDVERAMVEKF
jgi:hypothetical protein